MIKCANPFELIYAKGGWDNKGSGLGSQIEYNRGYIAWLQNFIKYNDIKSVVDFGCGDWTFSSKIDWQGCSYYGIDCVPSVIEANKRLYEKDKVQFHLAKYGDFQYPSCDLLIAKDVLQHWSIGNIKRFLDNLDKNTPFILLINDFSPHGTKDIVDGEVRAINLAKPPFSLKGAIVFSFGHMPDNKVVFLKQ